jgi:hypothetical protein
MKNKREKSPSYLKILALQETIKRLDQKQKQLSFLNETPKGDIDAVGIAARMHKSHLAFEKSAVLGQLSQPREQVISAFHQYTKRAYKELPQLFKFCLFKNKPKRFFVKEEVAKGKVCEYIVPVKEHINFRGMVAEVTYYEGELGDTDRMVYLAILNEAIKHKEFVKEFGRIPFSVDELADKAGLSKSGRRHEIVSDALRRLQTTNLLFKNGTGGVRLKERFHLIETYTSIEKTKEENNVEEHINKIELQLSPNDVMVRYVEKLKIQAQELLAKFKPRTPHLMLVTFNKPLMEAINGDEITTVDMWALQHLTRLSARTLFLYLYDLSQWRDSQEPVEISLTDLMKLMDLHPNVQTINGKEYILWNRSVELVKDIFDEVNQVAKFIQYFDWLGEGENTVLRVRLADEVLQIPTK